MPGKVFALFIGSFPLPAAPFNQVPEEGIEAIKKVLKENEAKGMH
jgi:hypothetical protein